MFSFERKERQMKRKVICIITVVMLLSGTTFSYAELKANASDENTQVAEELENASDVADYVERIVGTDNLNDNLEEGNDCYQTNEGVDVKIPKYGDDEIAIETLESEILMGLPDEVKDGEGVLTDSGTIVYLSGSEDASVSVQVLSEEQYGETFDAVRTMVIIENPNAPKEYSFDFTLEDGYTLIQDYDYEDEYDEWDCGAVYIVNENNEVISTIDPAWAIDANGNDVDTYYEIKGNTLMQIVSFDKKTAFPIIADPTAHPTKYTHYYTNYYELKKVVGKGYNSCQTLGISVSLYIASLVKTLTPGTTVVSGMLAIADVWSYYQFSKVKREIF